MIDFVLVVLLYFL